MKSFRFLTVVLVTMWLMMVHAQEEEASAQGDGHVHIEPQHVTSEPVVDAVTISETEPEIPAVVEVDVSGGSVMEEATTESAKSSMQDQIAAAMHQCEAVCADRIAKSMQDVTLPFQQEIATLHKALEMAHSELVSAKEQSHTSKVQLEEAISDKQVVLRDLEQMRKSLAETRSQASLYQSHATEHEQASRTAQKQLKSLQGQVVALEDELLKANVKFQELMAKSSTGGGLVDQAVAGFNSLWGKVFKA